LNKLKYVDVSYLHDYVYNKLDESIIVIAEDTTHQIKDVDPIVSNKDNIFTFDTSRNTKKCGPPAVRKSIKIDPETIDGSVYYGDALSDLRDRLKLFGDVYDKKFQIKEDVDKLIRNYRELLPNRKLNSKKKALSKLYSINPYMRTFVNKIKTKNLDLLIAGSGALYCVWTDTNFMPNDLDIYINDMQENDMQILEDVLYQIFDIAYFAVTRNHLTTTFHIQVRSGKTYAIQVNMFKIKSWAQIFVTYHSNITCVGYEVLTNRFLYMQHRFDDVLNDGIQYFSNILNFDNGETLAHAVEKYTARGFDCARILLTTNNLKEGSRPYERDFIVELLDSYYGFDSVVSPQHNDPRTSYDPPYFAHTLLYVLNSSCKVSSSIAFLPNYYPALPIIYASIYMIDKYRTAIDMEMAEKYFGCIYSNKEYGMSQRRIFQHCHYCNVYGPFDNVACCRDWRISNMNLFII